MKLYLLFEIFCFILIWRLSAPLCCVNRPWIKYSHCFTLLWHWIYESFVLFLSFFCSFLQVHCVFTAHSWEGGGHQCCHRISLYHLAVHCVSLPQAKHLLASRIARGSKPENMHLSNFQIFHKRWRVSETPLLTSKVQLPHTEVCQHFKRQKSVVKVSYSFWSVEYFTLWFFHIVAALVAISHNLKFLDVSIKLNNSHQFLDNTS